MHEAYLILLPGNLLPPQCRRRFRRLPLPRVSSPAATTTLPRPPPPHRNSPSSLHISSSPPRLRPPPTSPRRTYPSPSPSPSSPSLPRSRGVSLSSSTPPAPASPPSTMPSRLLSSPSPSLLPHPRTRLLLAASELARAAAPGFAPLLASLLRRVPFPGDARLLEVLHEHAAFLADEEPQLLATAVFAFLRLLSRNRLAPAAGSVECKDCEECKGAKNLQECRGRLVSFCVSVLRDHFQVCALLGRDLVRSLHELALVPEFQLLWRDLILDRAADICRIGTPRWCTAVAITSEMETQLLFMMNNVKWGDQKRYQLWFARNHLMVPGGEERIPDIVRFICCGYHPTNEVMQSGVIARWAVVGWLLTSCSKGYVVANAKLALFYDWLFFEEGRGSVMNIEPAMLLMVNSVSQYTDITNMLLEFLFLLIDNYDVQRKEAIVRCVRSAFGVLVKKGVVPSLEPLTGCDKLSPLLRQKLLAFLSNTCEAAEEACGKPINEVSKGTELNKRIC